MPDMEARVRDLLERRAADVEPRATMPPTLVRRAHRRFVASAGVVVIVIGLLVAGGAAALRSMPGAPVEQPGEGPTPVAVRWCTPDDLVASAAIEGAAGSREGTITVENRSAATCTLQGIPTPVPLDQQGQPVDVPVKIIATEPAWQVNREPQPEGWPLVSIAPGRSASLRVIWSNWCGDAPVWTLAMATGAFEVPDIGSVPPPCNGPGQPATIGLGPFEPTTP